MRWTLLLLEWQLSETQATTKKCPQGLSKKQWHRNGRNQPEKVSSTLLLPSVVLMKEEKATMQCRTVVCAQWASGAELVTEAHARAADAQ